MSFKHGRWLLCFFLACLPLAAQATEVKEWTMLVFLNGHNDLDQFGAKNIRQMEQVGSTDQVNVVVQWASLDSPVTKRLYITKSTNPNEVTSPVVDSLSPVDMGNADNLVEFVRWAKEHYPARHYFVDVWNHGAGWHRISKLGNAHINDISFDERFGTKITTKQLGGAIQQISQVLGQKLDIYGSDACLMAMAEVAGEMKDAVNVYVGAEETEPGDGWPYNQLLAEWNKIPKASAEQVGSTLVKEYVKAYSGGQFGKEEVTLAAYRMSAWPAFSSAVTGLAGELRNLTASDRTAVLRVAGKTQSYLYDDYKDLYHFTQGLSGAGVTAVNSGTLSAVQNAISNLVIENGVTKNYRNSRGISIWVPESSSQFGSYSAAYAGLDFPRVSGWYSVLSGLFQR